MDGGAEKAAAAWGAVPRRQWSMRWSHRAVVAIVVGLAAIWRGGERGVFQDLCLSGGVACARRPRHARHRPVRNTLRESRPGNGGGGVSAPDVPCARGACGAAGVRLYTRSVMESAASQTARLMTTWGRRGSIVPRVRAAGRLGAVPDVLISSRGRSAGHGYRACSSASSWRIGACSDRRTASPAAGHLVFSRRRWGSGWDGGMSLVSEVAYDARPASGRGGFTNRRFERWVERLRLDAPRNRFTVPGARGVHDGGVRRGHARHPDARFLLGDGGASMSRAGDVQTVADSAALAGANWRPRRTAPRRRWSTQQLPVGGSREWLRLRRAWSERSCPVRARPPAKRWTWA